MDGVRIEGQASLNVSKDRIDLKKRKLREACNDFEALFAAQLLKIARASIIRSEEPDMARSVYESMFDDAVAREMAAKGVLGLGEMLYEELLPILERTEKHK